MGATGPKLGHVALLAGALTAALLAPAGAAGRQAGTSCGPTRGVPGGEWPTYGHDYSNTRFQDKESVISVGDAPFLTPAWSFSTAVAGGEGDITGTPIVTGGCVYVATNSGFVYAMNADSGKVLWKAQVPYGGGISSSLGVR